MTSWPRARRTGIAATVALLALTACSEETPPEPVGVQPSAPALGTPDDERAAALLRAYCDQFQSALAEAGDYTASSRLEEIERNVTIVRVLPGATPQQRADVEALVLAAAGIDQAGPNTTEGYLALTRDDLAPAYDAVCVARYGSPPQALVPTERDLPS